MTVVLAECPKCGSDKHLRAHCDIQCDWMVCDKCRVTLDLNTGRFDDPKAR